MLRFVSRMLWVAIALLLALQPDSIAAAPLSESVAIERIGMTPDFVRSRIEQAAASWVNGDAQIFAALFAPDGEFVVPGQRWVGVEAIQRAAADFASSHSHVKIEIQRILVDHQQAVVEWQWEDVETSTGKHTRADDAIVVDFVGDRIKRWREYIDSTLPSPVS